MDSNMEMLELLTKKGALVADAGVNVNKAGFENARAEVIYDNLSGSVDFDKSGLSDATLRLKFAEGDVWINANRTGIVNYGFLMN